MKWICVLFLMCTSCYGADTSIYYGEKIFLKSHDNKPIPSTPGLKLSKTDIELLKKYYAENYTPMFDSIDLDGIPVYSNGAPTGIYNHAPIPYRYNPLGDKS